ncbi:MAG TPA: hypothetical protein VNM48_02170, partial [Chloroflexota bacterium]|nr:hypothetical protein [Chloroflexota bacterium]
MTATAGTQAQQTPQPPQPPQDQQQQPSATAGDATGGQQAPNGGEDRRFSQAEVDDLIKRRLERERQAAEDRTKREREAADEQRLKENQEFQKLADQRAKRIDELEPLKIKAERYEAALTVLLTEERKAVPEYVHPILDKLDPAEQLEWIAQNKASFPALPPATPGPGQQRQGQGTRAPPQTPR